MRPVHATLHIAHLRGEELVVALEEHARPAARHLAPRSPEQRLLEAVACCSAFQQSYACIVSKVIGTDGFVVSMDVLTSTALLCMSRWALGRQERASSDERGAGAASYAALTYVRPLN